MKVPKNKKPPCIIQRGKKIEDFLRGSVVGQGDEMVRKLRYDWDQFKVDAESGEVMMELCKFMAEKIVKAETTGWLFDGFKSGNGKKEDVLVCGCCREDDNESEFLVCTLYKLLGVNPFVMCLG